LRNEDLCGGLAIEDLTSALVTDPVRRF
jgi:hypothetical protein